MRTVMSMLLAAAAVAALPVAGRAEDERIEAITKPSEDRVLSFVRPGMVAKVLVKEGDVVKAGQELIRLDDEAEQEQIEQLKADAEDEIHAKAAEAKLAQSKVDRKKIEKAHADGVATDLELDHARLDVTIAELSLLLTKFDQGQKKRKFREAKIQLDRMRMTSPIDGKVQRILVEPGEAANALEKILQVVSVDPLWIDVPVPTPLAKTLTPGKDTAVVEFPAEGKAKAPRRVGSITYKASVADSASETLTVRVEVANPTARPAGERVYVSFSEPKTAKPPRDSGSDLAARAAKP
jgi:RND family efflux transporter MFP subunit